MHFPPTELQELLTHSLRVLFVELLTFREGGDGDSRFRVLVRICSELDRYCHAMTKGQKSFHSLTGGGFSLLPQ